MKKTWLVVRFTKDGAIYGPPTMPHETREEAKAEAERLANKEANSTFFVFEAVAVCKSFSTIVSADI